MSKAKFLLPLLMPLASCATSTIEVGYPDQPKGIEFQTCQQWLAEHARQTPLADAQTKWLIAVYRLNSLQVEPKGDLLMGIHTEEVLANDSEEVCKKHPSWTLKAMAYRLVYDAHITKALPVTG